MNIHCSNHRPGRVIIFGSVRFGFYKKKVTKPIKKTEAGSNQPVSVRFGF
jgi:hypothetical protein